MSVADEKKMLRRKYKEARDQERRNADGSAERAMGRLLAHAELIPPDAIVTAFLPIGVEIDPLAILEGFPNRIALPVMVEKAAPLAFRLWSPGHPLDEREWGIRQPTEAAPEVIPNVLLVPLLAVDRLGYRLGYGGGYFDRTLAKLRAIAQITAIGLALEVQRVDVLPRDAYDEPVDFILTPSTLVAVDRDGRGAGPQSD